MLRPPLAKTANYQASFRINEIYVFKALPQNIREFKQIWTDTVINKNFNEIPHYA